MKRPAVMQPAVMQPWALALVPIAALALTAVLGREALGLRIRVHDLEFLPQSSEVLTVDEELRLKFGSNERFIICFESHQRTVTDPVFLEDLDFFVRQLQSTHNFGVLLHDRLARARFRADPVAGEPYFLHPPDAAWIERALESSAMTRKLAVGRSRRGAFLETPSLSGSGVASLVQRVNESVARLEEVRPGEYTVRVVGRDVVLNGLGQAVFEDLARLLPWSFALMFLLLLILFRSFVLALIALAEVGLAVTCTMGLYALLGHQLSLMTALVPVLVTVLGIADEIHLFGEYLRLSGEKTDSGRLDSERLAPPQRAGLALRRVFFPITATTLTTAIGFSSFLVTDVPALRSFGLLASLGVCFSWLFTVTAVPACLALLPSSSSPPTWTRRALPTLSRGLRLALPLVLSIFVIPGVLRLRVDDGWTRNFQPEHPIVRDVSWYQRESVGLYQFDLVLRRDDGRLWNHPELLAELDRLVTVIEDSPAVSAAFSVADLVRDRAWELGDTSKPRPPIPSDPRTIRLILDTFLSFNEQIFVDTFLDREHHVARLMVFTTGDDYHTSQQARQVLEQAVREVLGSAATAQIGGSAERGRVLIETIVTSQGKSILALLLVSWLTLGLASRQWRRALRCVAVISWALAVVLGFAGWVGLDLGVASSCFVALGLGVGLDYAIHLAFVGGHRDPSAHGRVQLRVLANVVVVGLGLSVLMLSANPTIVRLGILIVLSMVVCGFAVLIFFNGEAKESKTVTR